MAVARELWKAGISAEFSAKIRPRIQSQFGTVGYARLAVIIIQEELDAVQVRLRCTTAAADADQRNRGESIPWERLIEEVRKRLSVIQGSHNY
jgi:histidyl-tRNA synthetase